MIFMGEAPRHYPRGVEIGREKGVAVRPEKAPSSVNVRTPLESLFGKLGIEFANFR